MTRAPDGGKTTRQLFREGMRDGTPIALGYLVVSFTLGITAHNAGLDALREESRRGTIAWLSSSDDPHYIERAKMLYAL